MFNVNVISCQDSIVSAETWCSSSYSPICISQHASTVKCFFRTRSIISVTVSSVVYPQEVLASLALLACSSP